MSKALRTMALLFLVAGSAAAGPVEPWRAQLYTNWKNLPEPPVMPYDGPFGGEARAFVGPVDYQHPDPAVVSNWKARDDYSKTGRNGIYDPVKDPRPINAAFAAAILDDWDRMGYNCAYKGQSFTFMVGAFLKSKGLLGAVDQTLFGANGPPPLQFDGKEGARQREACGSFFDPGNYQAGVAAITGMGHHYGGHLFTVKDHKLTSSWDEVGLRTRAQMDYRGEMANEFRRFLKEVWFQDASPAQDSNQDGRTYNGLTGENLETWDDVNPLPVSLDWTLPARNPDGSLKFSALPEVDTAMFREPGRYKLLIDFHRYFTFEFFRRINEEASQAIKALGTPGRITCYPFAQHFIIWPGANQRHGNSFYWYHRLSPVVNVEHCWPDAPTMNLNYAITDRLAPRYKNPVMGWIWFYFGQEGFNMYNGPHAMDRALARLVGHNVDGTTHWLYSPRYRGRDQQQRRQIAYWQNFFKTHYPGYLSKSAPIKPQIALLMPDTSGYFYRYFQYPKGDFAWTGEAFQNLQLSYHLLTEEEIELGDTNLSDYKVLYVVGAEWSTPTIRRRIVEFIAQGGTVFANVDSLTLDIATGKRIDFLEQQFGVKLIRKYKNAFFPSAQSAAEALWALQFDTSNSPFLVQGHSVHDPEDPRAWARLYARTAETFVLDSNGKPMRPLPPNQGIEGGDLVRDPSWRMLRTLDNKLVRDEAVWQQLDEAMAKMPGHVLGIPQSPLDMRTPPVIHYAAPLTAVGSAPTWGEVDEATPVGDAKPIAWWGDKVVGLETAHTVWFGTREGVSLNAISPRLEALRQTEPCNPFPSELPETYESHRPYAEALGFAARKAGVTRAVTLTRNGKLPMNLEVLPRVDGNGTLMVIVISHDQTADEYDVTVDPALVTKGSSAWSMLDEQAIERDTDGRFKLKVPAWGVSVFMVGLPDALQPIQALQAKLNRKDLSVPSYFADRPKLNEAEWTIKVPPIGE